jgi:hypothetical protein
MSEYLANDISTTLNGAINNSVTSITVVSGTGFPTPNFRIRIDDELMLVTSVGGGTNWTVTRGIEGSTAASHSNAAPVPHVITMNGLAQWIMDGLKGGPTGPTQNLVYASPNGSTGLPTFRALVAADMDWTSPGTIGSATPNTGFFSTLLVGDGTTAPSDGLTTSFRVRGSSSNAGQTHLALVDYNSHTRWAINGQSAASAYDLIIYSGDNGTWVERLRLVYGSGNLTVSGTIGATNFSGTSSGTNTGDQTNISGNAGGTAGSISGYNNPTTAATGSTIVYRDGSAHITGNYIFGAYHNSSGGGTEHNASNPPYVYGTNGGDNYHRTYNTGYLSVNYANSAGSAPASGGTATYCNNASAHWTSASIDGSTTSGNQVSAEFGNNGGTGDGGVAAISFHCHSYYGIHLHCRHDGYFGLGGWSSGAWRWYSDPSGNMVAGGNVTAYSDPRLKDVIGRIENPRAIIRALQGVRFTWKHGIKQTSFKAGKQDLGVLSDQVEKVLPEIVVDGIKLEGETYKTVCYEKFAPVLIEDNNGLDDRIIMLERRLAMLEARL